MELYKNKHRSFSGKVSKEVFSLFEVLFKLSLGQEISQEDKNFVENVLTLNSFLSQIDCSIKMKASIYYNRFCNFVDALLKEYVDLKDDSMASIIDYYIMKNTMKELNYIGVGL